VTDTQDKAVAGARLRLTAAAGGEPKETASDPDGRFVFPSVQPGNYEIAAAATGFADTKRTLHLV
jgi:hypothetical protein